MVGSSTTKWGKNDIIWYIYPPQYSPVAERAFSIWSKHANLKFKRSPNSPNISIAFVRGKHLCITNKSPYCYSPFVDGSGILAHAEYPSIHKEAVEIHLNDAITWHDTLTLPSTKNDDTSLFWVLLHEIGHGLGLSHSSDTRSSMFSTYTFPPVSSFDELDLFEEEIRAMQMLYGTPPKPLPSTTPTTSTTHTTSITPTTTTTTTTSTTTTTTPTTTKRSQPPTLQPFIDVCYYLKHIDAFLVAHKRLYLFYNNHVWIIPLQESMRLQRDYTRPKMINRWLRFLPANFTHISGIYQRPNKDIVMIANNNVYIFTYPHLYLTYQTDIESVVMSRGGDVSSAMSDKLVSQPSTNIVYKKLSDLLVNRPYAISSFNLVEKTKIGPSILAILHGNNGALISVILPKRYSDLFDKQDIETYNDGDLYLVNKGMSNGVCNIDFQSPYNSEEEVKQSVAKRQRKK
ncbi:matrix metalloproteinase-17-like [Rhodnius prolixus]|uniref:matrix metalloproteinase-17-like n=1 Tax=Rhodnius prolixus TaxID=13249 RepID=UPI003D18DF5D